MPDELDAMGPPNTGAYLFGRIQRATRWELDAQGQAVPPLPGARARAFVAEHLNLSMPEIVSRETSSDGSTKVGLRLADGALIEAVHMPREVRSPRVTVCISSQVGCALGCTFCATARMGLVRNLSAHEIVGQVQSVMRGIGPVDPQRLTLVFMGMGEPLHNITQVLRAVSVLTDQRGLGLAESRITVSTSGLVPQIRELAAASPRPQLALSLNATTDEARARTMPITNKYGIAELRQALLDFPTRSHEKITVAYVLLAGENDTDADADRLAAFVQGFRHVLNVIPYNVFPGSPFARVQDERAQAFVQRLHAAGCLVTVRRTRGPDVMGACGQLATESTRPVRLRRAAPGSP
jgi:23S rRNA (adenine2503-C2)-methyltransferase